MNKETFTIEEIHEWADEMQAGLTVNMMRPFIAALNDKRDGIAAWKARKKDRMMSHTSEIMPRHAEWQ